MCIRDRASAVDVVIQQSRLRDGTGRITSSTEIEGMEGEVITLSEIFAFDYKAGRDANGRFLGGLTATGIRPKFLDKLQDQGIELPPQLFARGGVM